MILEQKNRLLKRLTLWRLFVCVCLCGAAPNDNIFGIPNHDRFGPNSVEYQAKAMELLLAEVNSVIDVLHLQESRPLKEKDLTGHFVAPLFASRHMGIFGNLSTSNYTYYVSVANKFSFLCKKDYAGYISDLRQKFILPSSEVKTNAALRLAEKWLLSLSVDVSALNKDCKVMIVPVELRLRGKEMFVPVYTVYWIDRREGIVGSVASVQFFEPTKTLIQLRVEKPQYLMRKSIKVMPE